MTQTDYLAAEYALGLLEGEDLLRARGMVASDPDFADAVARWEKQLAPLLDEVPAATPRADLWPEIEKRLANEAGGAGGAGNVVDLQAQVTRWKWTAGLASAAAAVALAFLVLPQGAAPLPGQIDSGIPLTEPDLVATVPIGDTAYTIDLLYQPSARRLYMTSAGLVPDGVHDHELWLVPQEGEAQSLGVVEPGTTQLVELPLQLAQQVADGSNLVLTREPLGGAVPGTDAGPVVASGAFTTI